MNLHDLWSHTFKRTWPCQTCHVNISLLNSASLSSHSKSLAKNKCHLQYFNCFTCHSADSTANLPFFSCQICNIQSFKLSQFFLHKSLSRTNNVICSILAISLLECTLCGVQLSTFMHLCGGNLVFACLNGLPMPWQIVLTKY